MLARRNLVLFLLAVLIAGVPPAQAMRIGEYLEQFDLDSLSYVGMLSEQCGTKKVLKAKIVDSNGFSHVVQAGNYIGRNFGVVTRIGKDRIEVREVFQGVSGAWNEKTTTLPVVTARSGRARVSMSPNLVLPEQCQRGRDVEELAEKLRKCFATEEPSERLVCYDAVIGR